MFKRTRPNVAHVVSVCAATARLVAFPAQGAGLFVADFETQATGLFENDRYDIYRKVGNPVGVSMAKKGARGAQVRAGNYAVRIKSGPQLGRKAKRTELVLGNGKNVGKDFSPFVGLTHGREYWIGFSLYRQDWKVKPSVWTTNFQTHTVGGEGGKCREANAVWIGTGYDEKSKRHHAHLGMTGFGKKHLWKAPVEQNKWGDYVMNLKLSSKSDGFVKVWRNGKVIVDKKNIRTAPGTDCHGTPLGEWNRLKYGIYQQSCRGCPDKRVIFYDEIRIGSVFHGYRGGFKGVAPGGGSACNPPCASNLP